jgi:hypothetical protein
MLTMVPQLPEQMRQNEVISRLSDMLSSFGHASRRDDICVELAGWLIPPKWALPSFRHRQAMPGR